MKEITFKSQGEHIYIYIIELIIEYINRRIQSIFENVVLFTFFVIFKRIWLSNHTEDVIILSDYFAKL